MQRIFMENDRDIRVPKFLSPLNAINISGSRRYNSKFDPYASDSSDAPSPLMKYLRSADKAGTAATPPAFTSTVNVEEDVIVMDGIPITKFNKASGEVRKRLPLAPFNSVTGSFGRSNSASSSSSGSGSRGGGSENSKLHKNKLCRYWETSGTCQFGSECQFAHGKEELRPHRSSSKLKPEIFELNSSLEGSSSSYGSKSPPIRRVKASAEEAVSQPSTPTEMALPKSPLKIIQPSESIIPSSTITNTALLKSDWTPENDGIEVSLPFGEKNPSTEDVDAYMEKVLYGTPTRKRLPVFVRILPDL
ncbi:hypothetical protein ACS0TY_011564 [Phlomoides rotata]